MYNYGEIKLQNKQDAFSAMYFFVSTSILEFCGRRNGEKICREAMRRAGRESGLAQKKKFIDAGIKTNLQTLFHSARDYVPDPRFHAKELFNEEQRQVYEIFTCPMADFWNSRGGGKVGSFFCEEYHYARLLAFTDNVGQLCLSNYLTCPRDNFCHIAAFYREANMTEEAAKQSFTHCDPDYAEPELPQDGSFDDGIRELTASVYYHLLEVADEMNGNEGVCAVAEGLKKWAEQAIASLKVQASHTLRPVDAEFVRKNFPLLTNSEADDAWNGREAHSARTLMQSLVLDRILEAEG